MSLALNIDLPANRLHYYHCESADTTPDELSFDTIQNMVVEWRARQRDLIHCKALGGDWRLAFCIRRQKTMLHENNGTYADTYTGKLRSEFASCQVCRHYKRKTNDRLTYPPGRFRTLTEEGFEQLKARNAELRLLKQKQEAKRGA